MLVSRRRSATTARAAKSRWTRTRPPGSDFLAEVCVDWEAEARARRASSGCASCQVRTGVVLDRNGGALGEDAAPLQAGRRRAGGRRAPVHLLDTRRGPRRDDPRRDRRRALERAGQRDRARARLQPRLLALAGRVLHGPPAAGARSSRMQALYGDMAEIVTSGARVMPAKALVLGYQFRQPRAAEALRSALGLLERRDRAHAGAGRCASRRRRRGSRSR